MKPSPGYVRVGEIRHSGGVTFPQLLFTIVLCFVLFFGYREYKEAQAKKALEEALRQAQISSAQEWVRDVNALYGRTPK